jgi:DNA-binding CsgD family transcriptional regulator
MPRGLSRRRGEELSLAHDRKQLLDELDGLTGAAAQLADETRVVALAAEAMSHACPRAIVVALTRRPDSGRFGAGAVWRGGKQLPCPPAPSPSDGRCVVDVDDVPEWQRNRWVEPIALGVHPPDHLSGTHPIRAALPWLNSQAYGRIIVCHGTIMVAWIGAYATGKVDFTDAERRALTDVAARAVAPLRAAAVFAGGLRQPALTPRQRELIRCLARGMTNKQIARALNVSAGTVKTMLERLYCSARVSGRAALVARYGRRRL